MRKSWNNPHGIKLTLGVRSSLPLEGLIVQPSALSQREIGSIMRDGKKRMRENHDTVALQQAFSILSGIWIEATVRESGYKLALFLCIHFDSVYSGIYIGGREHVNACPSMQEDTNQRIYRAVV